MQTRACSGSATHENAATMSAVLPQRSQIAATPISADVVTARSVQCVLMHDHGDLVCAQSMCGQKVLLHQDDMYS
jgi:hypothetical protein